MNSLFRSIQKAPQSPGTYIFKSKTGEFLYIGKAGNLKNRIRQYLRPDPERPFLKYLMNEAEKIDFKTTGSEIEALILESKLIKEKQPKYNVMLRDGKQYFYAILTNEEFPKIFLTHQVINGEYVGPFTDGSALKTTVRLLRRIFPYCTCKQKHNNFCLNYHIGKCPGFCCIKNPELGITNYELRFYIRNIKAIKNTLAGKKDSVIKKLKKELNLLAERQDFEKAIELRDKIEKLEKVFENAKIIRDAKYGYDSEPVLEKLAEIFKLPTIPRRIEGYDISNIQGKNAVGAMVVFTDAEPYTAEPSGFRPDKNEYRKFKIYFKETPDDTAMLKEILLRRFNHPEWPRPDLVFIDGGKGQLNAADGIISNFQFPISKKIPKPKFQIPVISLAKGKEEIFSTTLKKSVPLKKLPEEVQNLIKNIDAEAHRFAISYYRKIHRRKILE